MDSRLYQETRGRVPLRSTDAPLPGSMIQLVNRLTSSRSSTPENLPAFSTVTAWLSHDLEAITSWEFVEGPINEVPDSSSRLGTPEEDDPEEDSVINPPQLTTHGITLPYWETISRYHNSGLEFGPGGHGNVDRTLDLLDEADIYWKGRKKHVRRFIRRCPWCQKMDQIRGGIHHYP